MGFFDWFRKTPTTVSSANNLFSKSELEDVIRSISKLGKLFMESYALKSVGGNRNITMMSRAYSYASIFGFYYEKYGYGKYSDIADLQMTARYMEVKNSMSNVYHEQAVLSELANNWSDVLQVIYAIKLEKGEDLAKFNSIEQEVVRITNAIEKLSGKKCKTPVMKPKHISYNPYNITEDPQKSMGHTIPDLSDVFRRDLAKQYRANLTGPSFMLKSRKDIVVEYAIDMIKSYYDNAGFVPMCIVDQITDQVGDAGDLSDSEYEPFRSLKECVLDRIYKED